MAHFDFTAAEYVVNCTLKYALVGAVNGRGVLAMIINVSLL